jgi:4'-phosphopantetheinyl transferase
MSITSQSLSAPAVDALAGGASTSTPNPTFRLFIDARRTFPWSQSETRASPALTAAWANTDRVATVLEYLPEAEQEAVKRYFRPSDAARSLCSYLLKHLAIVRACNKPFSESKITAERGIKNGKPFFAPGGVEFNVTHHGDIVALIATSVPDARVGIDVVQVDLERDRRGLNQEGGFAAWVEVFKDVFSPREMQELKARCDCPGGIDSQECLKKKLRKFYTHWACKEAYIKMTGDALMAPWLQQLEFPSVTPPTAAADLHADDNQWKWGETTTTEVTLHEKVLDGVRIEVAALNEDYMIATAVDNSSLLPEFEQVFLSSDASSLECRLHSSDASSTRKFSLD